MFDLLTTPGMVPFSVSFALIIGLLCLEIIALLLGGSLLTGESDMDIEAPELDMSLEAELDGFDVDGMDLDSADFADFDTTEINISESVNPIALSAALSFMGLGQAPFMIWLAAFLLSFGLSGYVIQLVAQEMLGQMLPAVVASLPAVFLGGMFTKRFTRFFARLLPSVSTSAVSERHMGRRIGIITQGTAERGRPAEVKLTDRVGNTQYLRAEPLKDDIKLEQGTKVLILRQRSQTPETVTYRLVGLGPSEA